MKKKLTITAEDPVAQQHSNELQALICQQIEVGGGHISFAQYMQLCLYQPGLGYYSAGSHKLGQGGDFTTAPEITPLFAMSLAHHVHDALQQTTGKQVLEFGAGSGRLAADMLKQLDQLKSLPQQYLIIEASADLRQRQQQHISKAVPEYADKVRWLDTLPAKFNGVIVANEVCDAMPVHLLQFTEEHVFERCVTRKAGEFDWLDTDITDARLCQKAEHIRATIGPRHYLTEVNLFAEDWIRSIAANLEQGAVFIIDYGYPFAQYYHADKSQGCLRCYYRQQGHDDPLILQGLQDITSHVEFTSLAEAAVSGALDVAGFHEQGEFLIAANITDIAASFQSHTDALSWLKASAALKQLLLPEQMGHNFKVLSLTKALEPLPRLQFNDRRYQL
ncbi:class I SAM-dependent methyltransferase [Methylophaga sp. OBS4]|uniref:class I SAM-dependent methyltransferase n=1 Tax=Methylophaga sp. OBS4 TaxID=2991935 RepID=UPI0022512611|nr:SAM-dependent methyltransferase [Methylophaga sp. OBS4]MCX4188441.1 SAM-dependent methyltransferase [Methylophaga sp. OBS4]